MSNERSTSISSDQVDALITESGLPVTSKSAFKMVGHPNGVRLAVAKSKRVSRVFVYHAQPTHPGVIHRDEEYRKEMRYGAIQAEIDFTQPEEVVLDAIRACLKAVASAPAPSSEAAAEAKPKAERKPRAKKAAPPAEETTEAPVETA